MLQGFSSNICLVSVILHRLKTTQTLMTRIRARKQQNHGLNTFCLQMKNILSTYW